MSPRQHDPSPVVTILIALFGTEIRAWRGLESLGKIFWGYGILGSAALAALYVVAMNEGRSTVLELLLLSFALYTPWLLVAIWRCASNSHPLWTTLARSLTVAWAINTALVLLFLQLNLLT